MEATWERKTERSRYDYYPTQAPFVREGLASFVTELMPERVDSVLDPGAGGGVWGKAARKLFPDASIWGVELQLWEKPIAYDEWIDGNYLADNMVLPQFDLIVGNPPYSRAEAFVRRSYDLLNVGGYLVMLLRLSFLEGQGRGRGLWQEIPPLHVSIYSTRPSFMGKLGDNAPFACGIFMWRKRAAVIRPTFSFIHPDKLIDRW